MNRLLHSALAAVRGRRRAVALALALPPLAALTWLALRQAGTAAALLIATAAILALLLWQWQDLRRIQPRWLVRALDAADPRCEDSAALLLAAADTLPPLAQLQRERLLARLAQRLPELRPAWPRAAIAASLALSGVLLLLSLWSPQHSAAPPPDVAAKTTQSGPLRLLEQRLDITPPRYTGLAASQQDDLDARVPQGSLLRWELRFSAPPRAVRLRFHDGHVLALQPAGDSWSGERTLDNAALYRIEVDADNALADDRRLRLDTLTDQAPQIRVEAPDKTLSLREAGQDAWEFDFRASDDYGLGEAVLDITRAQGSGENIEVQQQSLRLRGEGTARERRYRHRINLAALDLAPGDELIVRLDVSDKREPQPQQSRSASYILRLPPPQADQGVGVEGLVRKTLPAYFRSQRQIIIDTEALLAEKPKLSAEAFVEKSDELGVQQKILRLRYGQFLGEEFESGGGHGATPAAKKAEGGADEHADEESGGHAAEAPGHDDHAAAPAKRFGDAGNVLAEFGHTHDHAEAATLLDPDTKRILKVALQAMWQAELQLRSGAPAAALPHEYKALEQIKLVQQASRIYLARVGLELPPVDEARRLSGERKDVRNSDNAANPATAAEPQLDAIWQSLERNEAPDWAGFDNWLGKRDPNAPGTLDLAAAADSWRRDPACRRCRDELRDRLWPLLPRAAAAAAGRRSGGAAGKAYLQALQAAEAPP